MYLIHLLAVILKHRFDFAGLAVTCMFYYSKKEDYLSYSASYIEFMNLGGVTPLIVWVFWKLGLD
jgi:hypothetical protein